MLDGAAYEPTAVHRVAETGIARTFQNIRLFGDMTALENVMVGRHVRTRAGVLGAVLRTRGHARRGGARSARARWSCSRTCGIAAYAEFAARTLSYGDQRRLEIARALATDPKLLALDEPAAGMNATEKLALRDLLVHIRADGRTILLIEHDVKLVMGLCDRRHGARLRQEDRRGRAGRRAARSRGHRSLPGSLAWLSRCSRFAV